MQAITSGKTGFVNMRIDDSTSYDPTVERHRIYLAQSIKTFLVDMGFKRSYSNKETFYHQEVYELKVGTGIFIIVYSSIIQEQMKSHQDSKIKVCAIFKELQKEHGLMKADGILLRGSFESILDKLIYDVENVWGRVVLQERCKDCSGSTFISSKGNKVCARMCFRKGGKKNGM